MPTAIPPDIQARLYDEADARFWGSTAFRVGHKLDPKDPVDKKMIPVYMHILALATQQWRDGVIRWTHDDDVVHKAIADAQAAAAQHSAQLATAAAAPTPDQKQAAVKAAEAAHEQTKIALEPAIAVMTAPGPDGRAAPPIVTKGTHELSKQAAHEIRQFVMNASGMGVPVGPAASGGMSPDDAAAVMAATSAPASIASQVGDAALATTSAPMRVAAQTAGKIPWKTIGIVGGVAAAIGGLAYFVSQRGVPRRVAHAR